MEEMERFFLPVYLPYLTDLNFAGMNDPTRTAVMGSPEYTLVWDIQPNPRNF